MLNYASVVDCHPCWRMQVYFSVLMLFLSVLPLDVQENGMAKIDANGRTVGLLNPLRE